MKLVSLNIEGNKHLDSRIPSLIQAEQPDVVCFQEVFEQDLPRISQMLGMEAYFVPTTIISQPNPHMPAHGVWGIAHFTRLPVVDRQEAYYVGSRKNLPTFFDKENPNAQNRVLVSQTMMSQDQSFTVATTHFTWSPNGSYSDEQRHDFESLRSILEDFDDLILCGDFNSPRNGGPDNIYNTLAGMYQDAIPTQYTTSVDSSFHKSGRQLELMVDGLFLSPHYQASDVKLVSGVSDHMAIVAEITRKL